MSLVPRDPEAFSLDSPKKRRERNHKIPKHLAFVRSLCCVICNTRMGVEAAHIRYRELTYSKPGTAMGQKPDDRWTVPLCKTHHRDGPASQHGSNEREWWIRHAIDPCAVADAIFKVSGDQDAADKIVAAASSPNERGRPRA